MFQRTGRRGYKAGANGTVTLPKGAILLQVVAHASAGGATMSIFGGDAMPVINGAPPTVIPFLNENWQARDNAASAGSQDVVFTGTDSYFVEWVQLGMS